MFKFLLTETKTKLSLSYSVRLERLPNVKTGIINQIEFTNRKKALDFQKCINDLFSQYYYFLNLHYYRLKSLDSALMEVGELKKEFSVCLSNIETIRFSFYHNQKPFPVYQYDEILTDYVNNLLKMCNTITNKNFDEVNMIFIHLTEIKEKYNRVYCDAYAIYQKENKLSIF